MERQENFIYNLQRNEIFKENWGEKIKLIRKLGHKNETSIKTGARNKNSQKSG